jgi:hypothetical protein
MAEVPGHPGGFVAGCGRGQVHGAGAYRRLGAAAGSCRDDRDAAVALEDRERRDDEEGVEHRGVVAQQSPLGGCADDRSQHVDRSS